MLGTGFRPPPPPPSLIPLSQSFTKHVYVRSLSAIDRALSLNILRVLAEKYGQTILDADVDLLDHAISAVDGERDPRCLLQGFQAITAVIRLYVGQDTTSLAAGKLEESTEELFDVLSCYFPIVFTPPPNDPHKITREQIAQELERSLTSNPAFVPHIIQLVAEKLGSTLAGAKYDALGLLRNTVRTVDVGALQGQIPAVWAALKGEIMSGDGVAEGLLEPDRKKVEAVAAAAADCLRACVVALGQNDTLVCAVLEDGVVRNVVQRITSGCSSTATTTALGRIDSAEVHRTRSTMRVLGALGGAGGSAAQKMLNTILASPSSLLFSLANTSTGTATTIDRWNVLQWLVLSEVLQSLGNASTSFDIDADIVHTIVSICVGTVSRCTEEEEMGDDDEDVDGDNTRKRSILPLSRDAVWNAITSSTPQPWASAECRWLALSSLLFICRSPLLSSHLSSTDVASRILPLLLSPSITPTPTAISVVCALSQSTRHGPLILSDAVPVLFKQAVHASTLTMPEKERKKGAFHALRALCAANPHDFLTPVMMGLDEAVQLNIRAAFDQDRTPNTVEMVCDVLDTATDIMLDMPRSSSSSSFSLFVQHVIEAVGMVDTISRTDPLLSSLEHSLSSAVFVGTVTAGEEDQRQLAALVAAQITAPVNEQNILCRVVVSCGVFVALRPTVVREMSARRDSFSAVLRTLVASLQGMNISSSSASTRGLVAKALASIANKIDADDGNITATVLVEAVSKVGDALCIAEIARGFALRASPEAASLITDRLLLSGAHARDGTAWYRGGENAGDQIQTAAVDAVFSTLLYTATDDATSTSTNSRNIIAVRTSSHAIVKPLWQQRLYTFTAAAIEKQQQQQRAVCLDMAGLVCHVPPAVLRTDARRALPWILQCIADDHVRGTTITSDTNNVLMERISTSLLELLGSGPGMNEAQASLPRLIPALLGAAQYPLSRRVREQALQCLALLPRTLPYSSLHPYKRQVVGVGVGACDDPKRSVRLVAALCREQWGVCGGTG